MGNDEQQDDQARELFLNESLQLCQQLDEQLVLLSQAPRPLKQQKLGSIVTALEQGAEQMCLPDILLLTQAIILLITEEVSPVAIAGVACDRLQHLLCDLLRLSCLTHLSQMQLATHSQSSVHPVTLEILLTKGLEVLSTSLDLSLSASVQSLLCQRLVQWFLGWSQTDQCPGLANIAQVTLAALQAAPGAFREITQVALAGCRLAITGAGAPQPRSNQTLQESAQEARPAEGEVDWTDLEPDSKFGAPTVAVDPAALVNDRDGPFQVPQTQIQTLDTRGQLSWLSQHTIFQLDSQRVAEIIMPTPGQITEQAGQLRLAWRGQSLTLCPMASLWPVTIPTAPDAAVAPTVAPTVTSTAADIILVVNTTPQPLALLLLVDRLLTEPHLTLTPYFQASQVMPHPCRLGWVELSAQHWAEVVNVSCLLGGALPAEELPKAPPNGDRQEQSTHDRSVRSAVTTVLVVDDSKIVRIMVENLLQSVGYRVLQAPDGDEAIARLQTEAVHLVICDIEMNNLNGFEFLRLRLQEPHWQRIPVLILSSHTAPEYRQLATQLGAAAYVSIPYQDSELLTTVRSLLKP